MSGVANARAAIDAFSAEVSELRKSWILWRRLFHRHDSEANEQTESAYAAAERSGEVMQQVAPTFFQIAGWHMLTAITSTICRLCDPARQGKNQNLSVDHVHSLLDFTQNAQSKHAIETNIRNLGDSVERIRPVRDKLIAHCDRPVATGLTPRPDPEIKDVRIAVERLVRFVHNVEQHVAGGPVALGDPDSHPPRDIEQTWRLEADRLIEVLSDGLLHRRAQSGNNPA